MTEKARDIKPATLKRLFALSGNQCAAPECPKLLIARDEKSIIAKICHIEAASPQGARYRAEMSDDERRHFDNLILLCDECHTIIDNKENEQEYPVNLLKEWKRNHESKRMEVLTNNTSLLSTAINAIATINTDDFEKQDTACLKKFSIEDKIEYNKIKRNKSLIDSYFIYYTKINSLYNELEKEGSFKKEKLLRNINLLYLKTKGRYVGDSTDALAILQDNADNIVEDIENELIATVNGNRDNLFDEDITFGISVIMVDAFMRCKILEKPIKKC